MARKSAKRAAALKRVSIQQKRARDKEWHLKKRGAVPVRMETPRLNYSEVRRMTTQQLNAYGRKLEKWNSTPKTVLENGDVVNSSVIADYRKNVKLHNKRTRQQIGKLKNHEISEKARRILGTPQLGESVSGPIGLQEIKYRKPTSAKAAYRLQKKSKKWRNVNYKQRLKSQRKSAVDMLQALGMDKEANRVRNMESGNFEILVRADGLLDDLSLWYYTDGSEVQKNIERSKANRKSFATMQSRTSSAIQELSRRKR